MPGIVHTTVQNNYTAVVNYIWNYFLGFVDGDGNNRVLPSSAPLPVELVSFEAETHATDVMLNWYVATEVNNEKFEIEHSLDGSRFSTIGSVSSQGTTTNTAYSFLHEGASEGFNYYRLKQIDLDGTFEYSNVINVQLKNGANHPGKLYPNPSSSDFVYLDYTALNTNELDVQIFNFAGKQIGMFAKPVVSGVNTIAFNLSGIYPGVYLMKVQEGDRVSFFRFVKSD